MTKPSTLRVLIWIFALAPAVVTAALYNSLPEMIPMHWGPGGSVRHDPRVNIWWLTALSPALAVLAMVLPKLDPRGGNYKKFSNTYDGFWLFIMLFMIM